MRCILHKMRDGNKRIICRKHDLAVCIVARTHVSLMQNGKKYRRISAPRFSIHDNLSARHGEHRVAASTRIETFLHLSACNSWCNSWYLYVSVRLASGWCVRKISEIRRAIFRPVEHRCASLHLLPSFSAGRFRS